MRPSIFKFSLIALPLGLLTACQDYEPFDEAEVREAATLKKFNENFIERFGEIAPNHSWGFDLAESVLSGEANSTTRADLSEGYIYKQEADIPLGGSWYKTTELYGRPADITKEEHDEVFAWFSNHRVDWKHTPTNSNIDAVHSRETKDGGTNIIATIIDSSNPNYGSLTDYPTINPLIGNYTDNNSLNYYNGWIQTVAHDLSYDETGEDGKKYNSANMDYLAFRPVGNIQDWIHLNDCNGAQGYGWGRQPSNDGTPDQVAPSYNQNATLVLDAKFDVVTYGCSVGSSNPHNKYYIVYLKGCNYEGYYLGMDMESYTNGTANESLPADGICNDWIIKIGNAGAKPYNPARVMCEDLAMVNCDYDYNDIVYDVATQGNEITITVQAAGGTVPISMWYGTTQLMKVANNGVNTGEIHTLFGAPIQTPVNVNGPGVEKAPIVFKLLFNNTQDNPTYYDGSSNVSYAYYTSDKFNFQSIQVKVKHTTNAEWVTLDNIDGGAPVRFCVPNTVNWTREDQWIENAYPGFRAWVGNPTDWFWKEGKTIIHGYLHNEQ